MKIEIFNEEINSYLRGHRLNGDRLKGAMQNILNRLAISHIKKVNDNNAHDTRTLLMMLQMVWNEKEELVEKVKRLEGEMSSMEPCDDSSIAGSSLFTD